MQTKNIMLVGVGGQGTLLASKVLGSVLLDCGWDVKVSEVHGMSQRGGSVVTYVRYGERVYSPLIDEGEADIILAFEQLEAARWISYLKTGGQMIVNTQRIEPMPVITGAKAYPENLVEKLQSVGAQVQARDFLALACQAGSAKAVNIAMIGALARVLDDIAPAEWRKALEAVVPQRFLALNIKAFELGYA